MELLTGYFRDRCQWSVECVRLRQEHRQPEQDHHHQRQGQALQGGHWEDGEWSFSTIEVMSLRPFVGERCWEIQSRRWCPERKDGSKKRTGNVSFENSDFTFSHSFSPRYCFNMKTTIEGRSVRQKMTTSDLKTVENACDEALRWKKLQYVPC